MVDLAGSEKIGKTGVSGQTLEEAKKINLSLSALANVIKALTAKNVKHIPYWDSKLTRILTESLGGNSKTALIVTASPCSYNDAETVSTMRFGTLARRIQNKPKINEVLTNEELQKLLEKAEKVISVKNKRIVVLETFIVGFG